MIEVLKYVLLRVSIAVTVSTENEVMPVVFACVVILTLEGEVTPVIRNLHPPLLLPVTVRWNSAVQISLALIAKDRPVTLTGVVLLTVTLDVTRAFAHADPVTNPFITGEVNVFFVSVSVPARVAAVPLADGPVRTTPFGIVSVPELAVMVNPFTVVNVPDPGVPPPIGPGAAGLMTCTHAPFVRT